MKAREAQRRSSILHKEATKEAAMMRQFDELNRQRRQRVHESEVPPPCPPRHDDRWARCPH